MNSRALIAGLFLCLLLPSPGSAQDEGVKASASVNIQQDQEIWAGQQITINLDLKTTGFSFSDTHFNLPEVVGGFLMQTDSTTIKSSERTDGESWQIIRYPFALFPQKSGQLTVPPISVRFSSSAGFGTPTQNFEFETEALTLSVKLPPGVGENEIVVTTRAFQLDHDWQPDTDLAKTGDAFTLTVNRSAGDISAMLLPPLPVYRTSGLAAYPQTPQVEDKTNRGDLVGERTDSITWVVEEAGSYRIPGIRFKWWDPVRQELQQQVIPGISLEVVGASAGESEVLADGSSGPRTRDLLPWALLVLAGTIAGVTWYSLRSAAGTARLVDEKSTFTDLEKACKDNRAGEAHAAIYAWLACCQPTSPTGLRPVTLGEFSQVMNDDELAEKLLELQQAMITPGSGWHGDTLLTSLRRVRHRTNTQEKALSKAHLAPLNP
jgi:hypothetical protein